MEQEIWRGIAGGTGRVMELATHFADVIDGGLAALETVILNMADILSEWLVREHEDLWIEWTLDEQTMAEQMKLDEWMKMDGVTLRVEPKDALKLAREKPFHDFRWRTSS